MSSGLFEMQNLEVQFNFHHGDSINSQNSHHYQDQDS